MVKKFRNKLKNCRYGKVFCRQLCYLSAHNVRRSLSQDQCYLSAHQARSVLLEGTVSGRWWKQFLFSPSSRIIRVRIMEWFEEIFWVEESFGLNTFDPKRGMEETTIIFTIFHSVHDCRATKLTQQFSEESHSTAHHDYRKIRHKTHRLRGAPRIRCSKIRRRNQNPS